MLNSNISDINQKEKSILWFEIKVMKNQKEDICLRAIEIDPSILNFIEEENQTERVCLRAIEINPMNLRYIKNHRLGLCKKAIYNTKSIKQLHDLLNIIKNNNEYIHIYIREINAEIYMES